MKIIPTVPKYDTFYTRGADRAYAVFDDYTDELIFAGADKLWTAVMNNVTTDINSRGGTAEVGKAVINRTTWTNYLLGK